MSAPSPIRRGQALSVVGQALGRVEEGDPAEDRRVLELCAMIELHWPGRTIEPPERRAMFDALRAAKVTHSQAMDAVRRLVEDGREWPPRAPQILSIVKESRMHNEGQTLIAEGLRIEATARLRPEEVDAEVSMIDTPAVRDLVARAVAAARKKSAGIA